MSAGSIAAVTIRDCRSCQAGTSKSIPRRRHTTEPSLRFSQSAPDVSVVRSIVGAMRVERPRQRTEPLSLSIEDSIVDALGEDRDAIADPDALFAYVESDGPPHHGHGARSGARGSRRGERNLQ